MGAAVAGGQGRGGSPGEEDEEEGGIAKPPDTEAATRAAEMMAEIDAALAQNLVIAGQIEGGPGYETYCRQCGSHSCGIDPVTVRLN